MDLRQYLQAVRKFWWIILIPTVLGAGLGAFTASRQAPQYKSSVTFFVRTTADATTAGGQYASDQFAQRRVNSYVALLSTERFADMVLESTDLDLSAKQVSGMIGATGDINTVLLTATATSSTAVRAQAVATAISTQFIELVDEIENSDTPGAATVNLELVSGPDVSQVPVNKKMTIGIRAFFGLIVGFALALLLELRDTSVRSDEQLEHQGAGPLIGRIPFDRRAREAPLVIQADMQGIRAEAFRQLRTSLQFIDVERPIQVLIVTSAMPEEGKSSTSANLALAMVAANRRVLVIEADFRRPKLADYFGLERAVGLTDVLAGRVEIGDVLQPWGTDGLVVLPSGQIPPNPSELLGSESMSRLLEQFRSEFDMIIIDTPPLLPVTDAAVAATWADGVVLVVRYGKTTRHQVALSIRSLEAVGAKVLGSILTMVPVNKGSGYGAYRYEPETEPAARKELPSRPAPPTPALLSKSSKGADARSEKSEKSEPTAS